MPAGRPKQRRYQVRKGDTLWDIANRMYGDPQLWPAVGRANGLKDPSLLLIGQQLELPDLSKPGGAGAGPRQASPATPKPPMSPQVARRRARPVALPLKYELRNLPSAVTYAGAFKYELKMTGEVVFQSKRTLENVVFTNDAVVLKSKRETDGKLIKLAQDAKVSWTPGSRTVQVSCGFTVRSKVANGVWNATSVEALPPNGIRFKREPQPISFEYEGYMVEGKIGFEGTIRREDQRRPAPEHVRVPVVAPDSDTGKWVAIALLAAAGVILVATVAEDVVTLGAGLADDPLSFAAASAMTGRALAAFR
jgi:LysM repeat protein